jgi:hypothetical protein
MLPSALNANFFLCSFNEAKCFERLFTFLDILFLAGEFIFNEPYLKFGKVWDFQKLIFSWPSVWGLVSRQDLEMILNSIMTGESQKHFCAAQIGF